MKNPEQLQGGFITLVSYVPGPLGQVLDRLRYNLPSNGNTQAHITLLPPRPLEVRGGLASQAIAAVLRHCPPFDVQLSGIRSFPATNVLYFGIGEGSSRLHDLHDSLNSGILAHAELFEYIPHLTLSHPLPLLQVESTRQTLESAWNATNSPHRFRLEEVVLLWKQEDGAEWHRIWTQRLGSATAAAAQSSVPNR